jgi:ElaB/YqjD/DUF883 family membrane-anchored ribosome-binding protein
LGIIRFTQKEKSNPGCCNRIADKYITQQRRIIMTILGENVSKQKLMEDLSAVVSDAEELLKATASQTGERITAARSRAEETLKVAKVRLADAQEALVEKAKVAARQTDEYVHENPWKTAGIAAAVGGLLGVLIGALVSRR